MVTYRCAYEGKQYRCHKMASRKVKGQWFCIKHAAPEPIKKQKLDYPRAIKSNPEEWKAYHRLYRRKYRETHDRLYPWKKEVYVYSYYQRKTFWLVKHINGLEAIYHCECCCQQVTVKRLKSHTPQGSHRSLILGEYHFGKYYKISFEHICQTYPHSDIKYIRCDRCGGIGTNKNIHHNRWPRGRYHHDLCLSCWREMRPLFLLEEKDERITKVLSELKFTMRKAGINVNIKALKRLNELGLPDYTINWYVKHPYV